MAPGPRIVPLSAGRSNMLHGSMKTPTPRALSATLLPLFLTSFAALSGGGGGNETSGSAGSAGTTATDTSSGGGGAGGAAGGGGAGGTTMPQPQTRKTISGDATWQVTFDDTAKAAGATD